MSSMLSIDLPDNVCNLVEESAFNSYAIDSANTNVESQLNALTIDDLFPEGVGDQNLAKCCLSGLWLLHNFLDRSHDICQDIPTREGSFWHAIMHRMEGDFWNSKYWYRKAGNHAAFSSVEPNWDPEAFVDQCESAVGNSKATKSLQETAVHEWRALFEYCYQNAG